ncbi:MAG: VOC family protein [Acidimicrobiaceae bacterium]|nr:VOC family protein [Acidimicrobiaceae bacterium]
MTRDTPHSHYCALDCPDPLALADFYAALVSGKVEDLGDFPRDHVTWLEIMTPWGAVIGFQKVPDYRAPTWPDGPVPQQAHLDFLVDDLPSALERAERLGARRAEVQPGETFVVLLDPVGHPFCLVHDPREGLSAVG